LKDANEQSFWPLSRVPEGCMIHPGEERDYLENFCLLFTLTKVDPFKYTFLRYFICPF
jgi:hypothetical protein